MSEWNGKIVLVTGAGSGIGRALTLELVRRGAKVFACDMNEASVTELAEGGAESIVAAALDVRDADAWRRVADGVEARFGRIDALINSAGVGYAGDAHELSLEHWRAVLEVNLFGVINGVSTIYPRMVRQRSGRIVSVASLAGLGPAPFMLPYSTSKAGVIGLSRTLRIEAAMHGVAVNVVCPSAIDTPMLDRGPLPGLPPVPWRPNMRRYVTSMSGRPYPVEPFAVEALNAVERNEPVIVLPRRARLAWRLGRFAPALLDRVVTARARTERAAEH